MNEAPAETLPVLEVALHPLEVAAHGRGQAGVLAIEQGSDLGQRQPYLAEGEDAIQPPDVRFGVEAVGARPATITLNIDATLVTAHADKASLPDDNGDRAA